jgi:hypothetical protein
MERVDRLTLPPIKGEYYLVPTVTGIWDHRLANWPVIGPMHEDKDRFSFAPDHYHIDARFVRLSEYRRNYTFAAPLHAHPYYDPKEPLPAPIFRPRKCQWPYILYPHSDKQPIIKLRIDFSDTQCERGKGGWICPHRKASLGSIQPIGGIITCPLHGLQIHAATGKVCAVAARERTKTTSMAVKSVQHG